MFVIGLSLIVDLINSGQYFNLDRGVITGIKKRVGTKQKLCLCVSGLSSAEVHLSKH